MGERGDLFPRVGYDDWRARVEDELRGAPFDGLVSTLPGGILVEPLYTERPWGEGEDPRGLPGGVPFVRGSGRAGGWWRCARVDTPDLAAARRLLAADLRGGCDALWLQLDVPAGLGGPAGEPGGVPVGSEDELGELLADVDLDRVAILVDAGAGSQVAVGFLLGVARRRGAGPSVPRLFFGFDPIGELAASGRLPSPLEECEESMAAVAAYCSAQLPRSRAVTVSALPWHEAGATPVQELGWTLAAVVRYLRRMETAGFEVGRAAGQIAFRVAVGRDLFAGIAKLRALRWLWAKLIGACGVAEPPPPFVHAVSSDLSSARRDPWTNMLRVTTEVFGAAVGGADAITGAPYDRLLLRGEGRPAGSRFGRRVARNTQHVLAEEAHLGKVADPAGGSYYLEALTEALARAAWEEMRRVEAAGGIAEHLRSGRLRDEAEAAWRERRAGLLDGSEPVLGVSVYPPPEPEAASERRPGSPPRPVGVPGGESIAPLARHRLGEPFEDEGLPPPGAGGGDQESV
jgi:methylmalonyl-CoA mutase